MSESTYTKRYHEVLPPLANQVAVFPGSTTAGSQDLTQIGVTVVNMAFADNYPASLAYSGSTAQASVVGATLTTGKGCIDGFISVQADGADFGVIFGATLGAVSGTTFAPNLGATGATATGGCLRIVNGSEPQCFYIHPSARFMGFVGSTGAGFIRIYASSRSGG